MEHYGRTGEILRQRQVINNLDKELTQWKKVVDTYEHQPFAANIFVGTALRTKQEQLQKSKLQKNNDDSNTENQPPDGNENTTVKRRRYQAKSIEVIRKPLKVTKRVFPEKNTDATIRQGETTAGTAAAAKDGKGGKDEKIADKQTKADDEKTGGCCVVM
jgi:hypothetical protein